MFDDSFHLVIQKKTHRTSEDRTLGGRGIIKR